MSHEFRNYLRSCGIAQSVSPLYTPSHNGLAERSNRALMESAPSMIEEEKVDRSFWGLAVARAAHIHNRVPFRAGEAKAPLEHWTGNRPTVGHLRTFESTTYALVLEVRRQKLESRSARCILLGYDAEEGSRVNRL